jgi:hypothetical protein
MVKKIVALLVVASMFSLQTNINAGSVQSSAKNDSRKTQIGNDLAVDPEGKLYKIDYGELEPSADGIVNQVLIIKHTSISEPTADQRAQADNFFAQQAAAHPDAYKRTRGPLQGTLELDLPEPRESGEIQPFIQRLPCHLNLLPGKNRLLNNLILFQVLQTSQCLNIVDCLVG